MSEQHGRASILSFIESLKGNKGFEAYRQYIRVVPKGLFVDERGVDAVIEAFQTWIKAVSQGAADKTAEKTKQWLFETTTPERLYLVEGRHVLVGFVIPIPIQTPQSFGLPYYLGALLPTTEYIHPADPEIAKIKGLEVQQGRLGIEASVRRRDARVLIPESVIKSFRQIAEGSRFLQRKYPGCEKSLLVALRALTALVQRGRPVPKTFPLFVPHELKASKAQSPRVAGKFLFIEEKGAVTRIIELHGRHLSAFLRSELMRAPREKLGSFRLTPKHRDLMGFYESFGKRTSVHARAFAEFAELIRRAREPRERFSGWFTSVECFEKFSSLYQLSQPIERRKIAQSLERFSIEGHSFRLCGGWIFALSKEGTVMRTVARHIRLPGHRRGKE